MTATEKKDKALCMAFHLYVKAGFISYLTPKGRTMYMPRTRAPYQKKFYTLSQIYTEFIEAYES